MTMEEEKKKYEFVTDDGHWITQVDLNSIVEEEVDDLWIQATFSHDAGHLVTGTTWYVRMSTIRRYREQHEE